MKHSRFQITIEHELHDHVDGLIPGAHPQQLHNVPVIEPLHHLGFTKEIYFLIYGTAGFKSLDCNSNL